MGAAVRLGTLVELASVAVRRDPRTDHIVHHRIVRKGRAEAVHVAIEHAEHRGDENGVVNGPIVGSGVPGAFHVGRVDQPAAAWLSLQKSHALPADV